jgi:hypothetical protein
MIESREYRHPGIESQLIPPRQGTSMSRKLKYQPHPKKSGLKPYSKLN